MRSQVVLGAVLFLAGLVLLYLLRGFLYDVIVLVLGLLGLLLAIGLVFGGLALMFWRRRAW
jgi:hypothetical protein